MQEVIIGIAVIIFGIGFFLPLIKKPKELIELEREDRDA